MKQQAPLSSCRAAQVRGLTVDDQAPHAPAGVAGRHSPERCANTLQCTNRMDGEHRRYGRAMPGTGDAVGA
ncbi:hypothetical protein J7E95_40160, partial [Streptomyces sp. ISL-14]|nr:hypothetical protein [Streptomyces sp. ISL-14]